MEKIKIRYLLVVILLGVTGAIINALQYEFDQVETVGLAKLQQIPMRMGDWQGQDLPLEESVYEILETRAILHRNYSDTHGNNILLSVVHYHDTKVDFHAPESCLGGMGYRTTKSKKRIFINSAKEGKIDLEIAEVVSTNNHSKLLSYYFYKSGNYVGANYIRLRLAIAVAKMRMASSSGSLIRVSSNFTDSSMDQERVGAMLQEFVAEVFNDVSQ